MLAIDQGQKCIRGVELAKHLQQRLGLRNVAPERQKTTLGAFCFQDKKKKSRTAHLRSSARESRKQEQISPVYSSLDPGSFGGLQQLPWLRWLQHVRHVTSGTVYVMWLALVNVLAHTCCVWYSRATLKVIYTTPRCLGGTVIKYCGMIASHSWVRSTPAMYSGGSCFESQYYYREFWHSSFVVSLNTPCKWRNNVYVHTG